GFRAVGDDKDVALQLPSVMKVAENGNERRDACAARDEGALALVSDGTPDITQDQRLTRPVAVEPFGDAVAAGVEVALDGEFEIGGVRQRGESKGVLLVLPARLVE